MTTLSSDAAWDLADLVGASYVEIARISGEAARPEGLSLAQLVALAVLAQRPEGLSQSRWGRLQGVSRQRAHVLTRELSQLGLVTVSLEGRESTVRLTQKGRSSTARLRATVGDRLAQAMNGVDSDELHHLAKLLGRLLHSLRGDEEAS